MESGIGTSADGHEFVRSCEATEAAVAASFFAALPEPLAQRLGIGCRWLGQALLLHAAADVLMFNRVLGLGALEPEFEGPLDAALEEYRARGAKRFMVPVAPGPWAERLAAALGSRGYSAHNYWLRLARETAPPLQATTELRLAPLAAEDAPAFGALEAAAFDHPPEFAQWTAALVGRAGWRFFAAYDGPSLAAGAGVFVHDRIAWFGFAATRPEYRGRGAQTALIAHRLASAREAGCRWIVVETAADTPEKPNPSTHNLRRLGFRDVYRRPNWVKRLDEESPGSTAGI